MALNELILANELEAMVPVDNESDAIDNFANAFETYFYDSSVAGVFATPGSLVSATNAMKSALFGMSTDGANKIQSGIIAFWSTLVAIGASVWITAPVIILVTPPSNLSNIADALEAAFASNTSAKANLSDSAAMVAAAIHTPNLGGIATLGPPPPGGTPTPIL